MRGPPITKVTSQHLIFLQPSDPATQRIILKIVGFIACSLVHYYSALNTNIFQLGTPPISPLLVHCKVATALLGPALNW